MQAAYSTAKDLKMEFKDACMPRVRRALLAGVPAAWISRDRDIPLAWVRDEMHQLKKRFKLSPRKLRLE